MTVHKHRDLIIAWANGAKIERKVYRNGENINEPIISESWLGENMPMWSIHEEYRIKPEPKPDVVMYSRVLSVQKHKDGAYYAWVSNAYTEMPSCKADNLKLTFDGETGELKSAEVLK